MSVPSIRRFALLLLIIVPFILVQCTPKQVLPPPPAHKCPPANPKRYKPEITVDVSNVNDIKADPRIAVIWDFEPADPNGEPPFKPDQNKKVKITWTANNPDFDLWIDLKGADCGILENLDCRDNKCTASVKGPVPKNMRCTYEMTDKTKAAKDEDADVIVMPCCP